MCLDWALQDCYGQQKEAQISQFFSHFPNILFFLLSLELALGSLLQYCVCNETNHCSLPRYILRSTEKLSKGGVRNKQSAPKMFVFCYYYTTVVTIWSSRNEQELWAWVHVNATIELLFTRLKNFGPILLNFTSVQVKMFPSKPFIQQSTLDNIRST